MSKGGVISEGYYGNLGPYWPTTTCTENRPYRFKFPFKISCLLCFREKYSLKYCEKEKEEKKPFVSRGWIATQIWKEYLFSFRQHWILLKRRRVIRFSTITWPFPPLAMLFSFKVDTKNCRRKYLLIVGFRSIDGVISTKLPDCALEKIEIDQRISCVCITQKRDVIPWVSVRE